jgi:hypothetical protein
MDTRVKPAYDAENMLVPRTQRSAPFFTAWCAAEPGPLRTPVLGTVPVLRSGMKNAASRPGHGFIIQTSFTLPQPQTAALMAP